MERLVVKEVRVVPVDGVDVNYEWRGWRIWASWPTRTRSDIETLVRVEYVGAGATTQLVQSTTRINLLSDSKLKSLVTEMRRLDVDKDDINAFVHELAEDLIGWYRQGQATEYPAPAQRNGAGWLVYPVWPRVGVTAVAAAGGSYKSFLAQGLALQLATSREILVGNTRAPRTATRVLYLDWEADRETFGERLLALCNGAGLEPGPYLAYKEMRVPLVDAAAGLSDEIRSGRFGAVVVDSMSASVGGDLIDATHVNGFYDAVRRLGVPALVLAHKSAESAQKRSKRFYGSIMSENRVRLAWNGEKSSDGATVLWEVFKDNNAGVFGSKLAWRVRFGHNGEDETRRLASVTLEGCSTDDVQLGSDEPAHLYDKIRRHLVENGPGLVGEIAAAVGTTPGSVKATMNRHKALFNHRTDGLWEARNVP
jgi:hypothetical protein